MEENLAYTRILFGFLSCIVFKTDGKGTLVLVFRTLVPVEFVFSEGLQAHSKQPSLGRQGTV